MCILFALKKLYIFVLFVFWANLIEYKEILDKSWVYLRKQVYLIQNRYSKCIYFFKSCYFVHQQPYSL